jgi:hypothetical protein
MSRSETWFKGLPNMVKWTAYCSPKIMFDKLSSKLVPNRVTCTSLAFG